MRKIFFFLCIVLPFLGYGAEYLDHELAVAKKAAHLAGQREMHIFVHGKDKPVLMDDVCLAHTESAHIILKHLKDNFPSQVVKHEFLINPASQEAWWKEDNIWLFEPLDGLGDFDTKGSRFCITIGLIKKGIPVLGVYYFPATETFYWAVKGSGAFKQVGSGPIEQVTIKPTDSSLGLYTYHKSIPAIRKLFPVLLGRILTAAEEDKLFSDIGSIGFRICQIAEGAPTLYISESFRGKLWNFAAGQVILQEVGGLISDLKGSPLEYRCPIARIHKGVLICNDAALQRKVLTSLALP